MNLHGPLGQRSLLRSELARGFIHVLLDGMIDELLRLNSSRHASYFLLGFHDGIRSRVVREALPAATASQWRWYFAGYVAALGRRSPV